MTNVEALKTLYIALGGKTTDVYNHICNGEPVGDYVLSSDIICAIAQLNSIQIVGGAFSTDEDNNVIITSPNDIQLQADNGQILITSSDKVAITSENNNVNITADEDANITIHGQLYIEANEDSEILCAGGNLNIGSSEMINITGENDVNIISENSAIEIYAQGSDCNLKGDTVTANGKPVLTEN